MAKAAGRRRPRDGGGGSGGGGSGRWKAWVWAIAAALVAVVLAAWWPSTQDGKAHGGAGLGDTRSRGRNAGSSRPGGATGNGRPSAESESDRTEDFIRLVQRVSEAPPDMPAIARCGLWAPATIPLVVDCCGWR